MTHTVAFVTEFFPFGILGYMEGWHFAATFAKINKAIKN